MTIYFVRLHEVNVDRQAELPLEDSHTTAMVNVVMRNHDRIDLRDIASEIRKALLCLLAADTGVEQQSDAVGLDVNAIAITAGLQGYGPHVRILQARGRAEKDVSDHSGPFWAGTRLQRPSHARIPDSASFHAVSGKTWKIGSSPSQSGSDRAPWQNRAWIGPLRVTAASTISQLSIFIDVQTIRQVSMGP